MDGCNEVRANTGELLQKGLRVRMGMAYGMAGLKKALSSGDFNEKWFIILGFLQGFHISRGVWHHEAFTVYRRVQCKDILIASDICIYSVTVGPIATPG